MEGNDPDAIESATQTLDDRLAQAGRRDVQESLGLGGDRAQELPPDGGESNGAKTDEKVVDAEFEEVDKDKK